MTRAVLLLLVLSASLARATAPFAMLPFLGGEGQTSVAATNTLYCVRHPAEHSINATKLAALIVTGSAATTTGIGVYPDGDASSALAVVSGSSASSGTYVSNTGLTVNLTAGTLYRYCWCSTSTSVVIAALDLESTAAGYLQPLNGVGTFIGSSSNCTSGVPNNTTGALSVVNSGIEIVTLWAEE